MEARVRVTKDLESLLKLLSHPDRLQIVQALAYGERSVSELRDKVGLSASSVSQHLRPMLAKHLVSKRKDGRRSVYRLTQPEIAQWVLDGRAFLSPKTGTSVSTGSRVIAPDRATDANTDHRALVAIQAAADGDVDTLTRLSDEGVRLDRADYDGRTPLHLAAAENRRAAVRFLLEQGVARECVDRWGATPEGAAEAAGHAQVAADIRGFVRRNV